MSTEETRAVFEHHLSALAAADVDAVMEDYSEDAMFVTNIGVVVTGTEAIRAVFASPTDLSGFEVTFQHIDGDIAYVTWKANAFPFGSDTFVVRDGKIAVQTVAFLT